MSECKDKHAYVNGHNRLFSQLADIYNVSLSQNHITHNRLAKNIAKAHPKHPASAFTVPTMLLLGFTQATIGSPRTHDIILTNGR